MPEPVRLDSLPLPGSTTPGPAVPPPRFEGSTFESYVPSNESQGDACARVREFARTLQPPRRRWPWQRRPSGKGLYLDGGYGVGKTHLLAAAYHAAPVEKAYLTFQELVHLIGALGLDGAARRFESTVLVCVDEFELDDPGNTLIVKRFLEQVFDRSGAVITTSNTPADAQGRGRFNAEDFRREIQGIASRFETVNISGSDYRKRQEHPPLLTPAEFEQRFGEGARDRIQLPSRTVTTDFDSLLETLAKLHPIAYRSLLERFDLLLVEGISTIAQLNDALRFVHFIDQLYDRKVRLRGSGDIGLEEIFHPSYRNSAYQRKFERCASRLGELLAEPLSGSDAEDTPMEQAEGFD